MELAYREKIFEVYSLIYGARLGEAFGVEIAALMRETEYIWGRAKYSVVDL